MMRSLYVGYYRVSTRAQSRSGLGLEAQQETVRRFVHGRGEMVAEFIEVESGKRDQRVELAKAVATAKKHNASLTIARLDRFSRRVSFVANMMDSGISLVIAEMPNATDFQLHIFAALAQEERRLISERTRAALAQAKKRGTVLGVNGKILAARNRQEADLFAHSIASHLPENWKRLSYAMIADALNSAGVKTRTGRSFYPQTVKSIVMRLGGR